MDVVQRNFFRLLRSGTFGDDEQIEPMSDWKWRTVYLTAVGHGVAALVWDGVMHKSDNFFMQLSGDLRGEWQKAVADIEAANTRTNIAITELFAILNHQQLRPILMKGQGQASLYPTPSHRTNGDVDIYFPYTPQARKADQWAMANGENIDGGERGRMRYTWHNTSIDHHRTPQRLTNPLLNHKLQAIIEKEFRGSDSAYAIVNGTRTEILPPTLNLLLIIVRTAIYIINQGISLKQIVDMGVFLRVMGDKVDYVKLQGWLRQLGLRRIAVLEAEALVRLLHFETDEMQFVDDKTPRPTGDTTAALLRLVTNHSGDWYFTQGKNIFVRTNNSSAMLWHLRHNAKYSRYYPAEAVTNFVTSFAHSLSHIEE